MKITCPQCNASYNIPEDRMPHRNAAFTCKRCGKRVVLNSEAPAQTLSNKPSVSQKQGTPASTSGERHPAAILRDLPEATILSPEHFALEQMMPPDKKGGYKTKGNKLKLKMLSPIREHVAQILIPGEKVVCLAGAIAYYPAELFFGNGWMTMLYNRYILLATTRRLLAINTDYRMKNTGHYFFQFPYEEIRKISRGLFGNRLIFFFKRDKRRIFNGIRASMSSEIKKYIDSKIDPHTGPDAAVESRHYLCPGCFAPLGANLSDCPECGAKFKSPRSAAIRSLLLPGLGDFYLGHRFLGVLEIFGAVVVWMVVLSLVLSGERGGAAIGVVLLLIVNGMDGLLTLHMAKKGYGLDSSHRPTHSRGRVSPVRA